MTKLLAILLLISHATLGQQGNKNAIPITLINFKGDSISLSPNFEFNYKIKLQSIENSISKIDIRLYTHESLSNTKSVRRIYFVDKTWKAVEFDEWNNPISIKTYSLLAKPSFDSLITKLLSYNILTLPNQRELKGKMKKYAGKTEDGDSTVRSIYVNDGESYTVELKIGDKFRVFQFDNPETYSKYYDNVVELKNYLNIVEAFNKFLVHN